MADGATREWPAIAERFRASRLLKQGLSVSTWLGHDEVDGGQVVIKQVLTSELTRGAVARLEHEAQILGALESPTFARVLHVGTTGEMLSLVTTYMEGETLARRLRSGPLSIDAALELGIELFRALAMVHEFGVIHRDIKPSNLIVGAKGVALVDFGLSRSEALDVPLREVPVGTLRYISPEQAGLIQGGVDHRADLYSAGAVLYEALSGRPPILGDELSVLLRRLLDERPQRLTALGVLAPAVVDELVGRLLRKEPRERYQSAAAVVHDLEAVRRGLTEGFDLSSFSLGALDRGRAIVEPALIGREGELRVLSTAIRGARTGRGRLVLLGGHSGSGKSRLLAELGGRGTGAGCLVLRGRTVERRQQRPLELFDGVVDGLLEEGEGSLARLRDRLGDQVNAVGTVLPRLGAALGVEPEQMKGPEELGESRSVSALVALLEAVGDRDCAALVLLDDGQWADGLSLKAIGRWQGVEDEVRHRHVSLVLAYRSEEVGGDFPVPNLRGGLRLMVKGMTEAEVEAALTSMAGRLPPEVIDLVQDISGGSPFMVEATLRGLIEDRALVSSEDGWVLGEGWGEGVRASRRAGLTLAKRLDGLPEGVQRVLSAAAVLGREFTAESVAAVAETPQGEAHGALEHALRRSLVWSRPRARGHRFVHDRISEALLERLDYSEQVELHSRAARYLEEIDEASPFDIALHHHLAGDDERAFSFAVTAAEAARARFAFESALTQYVIAEAGAGCAGPSTRKRLAEGLGETLALLNRHDEALACLQRGLALASNDLERANFKWQLARVYFKRGNISLASDTIAEGLSALGETLPRGRTGRLAAAGFELASRLKNGLRTLPSSPSDPRAQMVIKLYSLLALVWWFEQGPTLCLFPHLRRINIAERYGDVASLAWSYSEHEIVLANTLTFRQSTAYADRAIALSRELDDLWSLGHALSNLSSSLYVRSRFSESLEVSDEALTVSRHSGDQWEIQSVVGHRAMALYRLGRLREAAALAEEGCLASLVSDHFFAASGSLQVWAWAAGGAIEPSLIERLFQGASRDHFRQASLYDARGLNLLYEGRPAEAAESFEAGWSICQTHGITSDYVHSLRPSWATALRRQALSLPRGRRRERRRILQQARTICLQALPTTLRMRNNLPHVLRELGLVSAALGHPSLARRILGQSLAVAESQDARYERAQTLLARGRLGESLCWDGALDDRLEATDELEAMGAVMACGERLEGCDEPEQQEPATFSLAEQFEGALALGREIATKLSDEEVLEAAFRAGKALLRSEVFLVVEAIEVPGVEASLQVVAGDRSRELSRTLVQKALASGRPQVLVSDPLDLSESSESVILTGIRSALAAPIECHKGPRRCLFASHGEVGGLYGPRDEQVAEYLAVLIGAALDNAQVHHELEESYGELSRAHEELQTLQGQLVQAGKLAALGQVGVGIAHELNQPLMTIRGFARRLKRKPEQPIGDHLRSLDLIDESALRMIDLVSNVRLFARDEDQTKEPISPREPLEDALALVGEELRTEGVEVKIVDELPDGVLINGDRARLQQVFLNLLINARDALCSLGDERQSRLEIALRHKAGGDVEVRVEDNGPGVEPTIRERLFEPFFTTKPVGKGTGLGLSIALGIASEHDGQLVFQEATGGGASFKITLPGFQASS